MLQTAEDWLASQLRALGAAIAASWELAIGYVGPALRTVRDWAGGCYQGASEWVSPMWHAAEQALRPYLTVALAVLAPYWSQIVGAAVVVVFGIIAIWMSLLLRRRRLLRSSLVNTTLVFDPKTKWFELGIVMQNLQRSPLLVRSIQIIDPPAAKICDRWQAWQPTTTGVKFVTSDMELTNSLSIAKILRPHDLVGYPMFEENATPPPHQENHRGPLDELNRRFYVLLPEERHVAIRARFICKLQHRRRRRQELAFRCSLPLVVPATRPARQATYSQYG